MPIADDILSKAILPTHLSSDEIRGLWAAEIRRRAFFSARTTEADYLRRLREICAAVADGEMDNATARKLLRAKLDEVGYDPQAEGDEGIQNLASRRRLDLILDTQRKMAHSAALVAAETPESLDQFPAWRLERYGSRRVPRQDWEARWKAAGDACGWEGASKSEMAALKASPIWQALGDGAGGFRDTLGNPYPPFAYGSGLDWSPIGREDAAAMGLHGDGGKPPKPTLTPGRKEVADTLQRLGPDFAKDLMAELDEEDD